MQAKRRCARRTCVKNCAGIVPVQPQVLHARRKFMRLSAFSSTSAA